MEVSWGVPALALPVQCTSWPVPGPGGGDVGVAAGVLIQVEFCLWCVLIAGVRHRKLQPGSLK